MSARGKTEWIWFQSAPGVNAGRYVAPPAQQIPGHGFNPLPALMPGDTWVE